MRTREQVITDTSKYFDIGYPEKFGSCHIGLYHPIENQFFLTLCNVRHAQNIALIASGRYALFVVDLTTADNYCENLIDNFCCGNWALGKEQILATNIREYANVIVSANSLIQIYNQNSDLEEEKKYLQLVYYSIKILDQIITNVYGWKIKHFMSDVFDFQDPQYKGVQNLKKQIMSELYLCKDIVYVGEFVEYTLNKAKKDYDLVF